MGWGPVSGQRESPLHWPASRASPPGAAPLGPAQVGIWGKKTYCWEDSTAPRREAEGISGRLGSWTAGELTKSPGETKTVTD